MRTAKHETREQIGIGWACIGLFSIMVIISSMVTFFAAFWSIPDQVSGKVSFETEQEYTKFKEWLSQDGINVKPDNISVLSSEPPIVVTFDVDIGRHIPSPYGNRTNSQQEISIVCSSLGALGVIGLGSMVYRIRNWNGES